MPSVHLSKISTRAPKKFDKEATKLETERIVQELDELQNLLYAEAKHAILLVIQGMDASGKDGLVRDVLSQLNPQGVMVHSFKVPSEEDLKHDFLWRVHRQCPEKGMIQVFNRSHYEDILVTRVHGQCSDKLARQRMKAINDFEDMLVKHNSTQIIKIYLHISPREQQVRLQERIDDPRKQWKHNESDAEDARLWKEYRKAYEDCFEHCSKVPWLIVPADQNWYKDYVVAKELHRVLKGLDMRYPMLKTQGAQGRKLF